METVQDIALEYLTGKREARIELLVHSGKLPDDVPEFKQAFEWVGWASKRDYSIKVVIEDIPGRKYYGTTVSASMDGTGRDGPAIELKWTVWEHEPDSYASRPSDRWCDADGLPHGISIATANDLPYDACLYDTHHESQFGYEVCYALAQLIRREAGQPCDWIIVACSKCGARRALAPEDNPEGRTFKCECGHAGVVKRNR